MDGALKCFYNIDLHADNGDGRVAVHGENKMKDSGRMGVPQVKKLG